MEFLRLLTLQIVEGRITVDAARAIVLAKAQAQRERRGGYRHRHSGMLTRQVEIAKAMTAGAR